MPCRLALILALDVSSSVDATEDQMQRTGLAAALTSAEVVGALLSQPGWPVAIYAFEWSGREAQDRILGWTMLDSEEAIFRAAAQIGISQRRWNDKPTALGAAVDHAAAVFAAGPACERQVLDVSGDGKNNAGPMPAPILDVTINGLPIGGAEYGLPLYFEAALISGPGAFVEPAAGYADFTRAMTRKLVRETGTPEIGEME